MKITHSLLIAIAFIVSFPELQARDFKGHLSADFTDNENNAFFIRKMIEISKGKKNTFELLSSNRKDLSLREKYYMNLWITDLKAEGYFGRMEVIDKTRKPSDKVILSGDIQGLLNGESELSFLDKEYQLTIVSNIDKVFTLEEIKQRLNKKSQ